MVSDERQRQLFALWTKHSLNELTGWLDQQPDKEELQVLLDQLEEALEQKRLTSD